MKVTAATGSFVDLKIKKTIRNSLERLSRHDLDNRITRGEACRGTGMLVSHAAGRLELNPMRMARCDANQEGRDNASSAWKGATRPRVLRRPRHAESRQFLGEYPLSYPPPPG